MAVKITPEWAARSGSEDGEQTALFIFAQSVVKCGYPEFNEKRVPGMAAFTAPLWGMLYAIPNGGERTASQGARMAATGTKKGFPDVGLPVARRRFHGLFIELKKRGLQTHKNGGCQQEQLDWHEKLRAQSYCVAIAYGWEEARDTIDWYLNGAE